MFGISLFKKKETKYENILVPRRLEERKLKRERVDIQKIQEFIKKGHGFTSLDLNKSFITKLPDNLNRVGYRLSLKDSNIRDLNKLNYVGDNLILMGSKISCFGSLECVGGYLDLRYCSYISDLGNISYIRNLIINHSCAPIKLPRNILIEYFYDNDTFDNGVNYRIHIKDNIIYNSELPDSYTILRDNYGNLYLCLKERNYSYIDYSTSNSYIDYSTSISPTCRSRYIYGIDPVSNEELVRIQQALIQAAQNYTGTPILSLQNQNNENTI